MEREQPLNPEDKCLNQANFNLNCKQIDRLKLTVEIVKDCKEEGVIGGHWTHLALKSQNSYLICTFLKGLKIIENGSQIFSRMLTQNYNIILDAVYIACLNCYLIASNSKLYRKDINNKPPYFFMSVQCGFKPGAYLRYSKVNQRLVINKDSTNICVVNPSTRKIEVELKKSVGSYIIDFRLFGDWENRVISVTKDGYVILYNLDCDQKRGQVDSHYKIKMIEERREWPGSLAVCKRNLYVFVEIGAGYCSRNVILKLRQEGLVQIACIDQYALESFGYIESHILWVGLSWSSNGPVQIFDYDTENGEFNELVDKRVSHQEYLPYKLHRLGDSLFYAGKKGKFMSLRLVK